MGSALWKSTTWIPVVVLLAAFFSYSNNIFHVVHSDWFELHQIDSEQLVLDGLLRHEVVGGSIWMGAYSRPGVKEQSLLAREFYQSKNTAGEFVRYKSQYGLQAKFFGVLARLGLHETWQLQAVAAAAMSLVVALLVRCVLVEFSLMAAVAVAGVFILSPWVVVFARNLYWVPATWFIPLVVAMHYSRGVYERRMDTVWMLVFLFCAYLLKLLCGYEYVTTFFLAVCVPIMYQGLRQRREIWLIAQKLSLNLAAVTLAFLLALVLHSHEISEGEGQSGWSYIVLTAQKRIASGNPEETARKVCNGDIDCEIGTKASLDSNPLAVTAKYFVFRDFLPWLGGVKLTQKEKEALKTLFRRPNLDSMKETARQLLALGFFHLSVVILSISAGPIAFLCLGLIVVRSFAAADIALRGAICVAFLAPLSWFFLAKGHSYVHYHVNYVLWYLPFVPYCFVLLTARFRGKELTPCREQLATVA